MAKYTDESGNVVDLGDGTIQQLQEETQRLRKHSETLLGEKKTEAQKRQEAEAKVTALTTDLDTAKAEAAMAAENAKKEIGESLSRAAAANEALKTRMLDLAVGTPVLDLANRITIAPDLAVPIIRARVVAEIDDAGVVKTKVLGKDGKPTDMSFDDLAKELAADERLKPIIKTSGARGGGSGPVGQPSGGAGGNKQLTTQERVAAARERHKQ